jgi:WhiB family redox-sensing transcriptional regulator
MRTSHDRRPQPSGPRRVLSRPQVPRLRAATPAHPQPTELSTVSVSVLVLDLGRQVAPTVDLPCHSLDPELFFAESPADVERAKAHCVDCPFKAECLDGALNRREPWGVWGGELFVSGVVVARKRPRGRPRKDEVAA